MNSIKFSLLSFIVLIILTQITFANEKTALLETELNTISIFKKSSNSVVNVSNIKLRRLGVFNRTAFEIPAGAGTGFVWDKKGHIVTNYHVVKGGDKFIVTFKNDKNKYKAKLVGGEPRKDIAILKLTKLPKKLIPIKIGFSKNLEVGQKAIAIGNPFGLDHTLTAGIISGIGRKIPGVGGVKIHGMIQTDASINPGNSGGPLIDSGGSLIGMNTVIYSSSGASAGVGFAVPVDTISNIVPQLIKFGRVVRPGLGVGILDDDQRDYLGIDSGIIISHVQEGTGANKAGLKGISQDYYGRYIIGDIIVKINNERVNNYDDLYHKIDKYKIGDTIEVGYLRKGVLKKAKIVLSKINYN